MSAPWPSDNDMLRRALINHLRDHRDGRCCTHPPREGATVDDDRRTQQTPAPLRDSIPTYDPMGIGREEGETLVVELRSAPPSEPARFNAVIAALSGDPLTSSPCRPLTITLRTLDEITDPELLRAWRLGRLVTVTIADDEL